MTILTHPTRWLYVSFATIVASLIVIFTIQPVWGIDFVGGSLLEVEANTDDTRAVARHLDEAFDLSATVQKTGEDTLLIRTGELSERRHQNVLASLQDEGFAQGEELRFERIGPTIGQELREKSLYAIGFVVLLLIIYLAYTFRSVSTLVAPWKFGVAAVYALVHDLLLVTALFVIFGKVWGATIDTTFVTAQLAILGYSVNDTIVLFNRFKWEWVTKKQGKLLDVINRAISATLSRSLNTSLTTLLVLGALLLFAGSTIHWFIVALALGTVAGTYSSIFVAPPLLHQLTSSSK